MLNRRHLRIKVLQTLYAYFQSNEDSYAKAEKSLLQSVDKIYDLYLYLLLSFSEIKTVALNRIEDNKKKIRPSNDDLNPNLKFVSNILIEKIENSKDLRKVSELKKINWVGAEKKEIFRKMFLQIKESETYLHHMNAENTGYDSDLAFCIELFKVEIANSPFLYNFFEEESIFWIDDIDLSCSMVLKTLKMQEQNNEFELLPLYKKDDDEEEFIRLLLQKTIAMDKENEQLIDDLTKNWELDRIAKMDVLLMKMAITELQVFNSIPTKVTLNEYIEISKFYSTPKSNGFINGILDKSIEILKQNNKIKKTGRGLLN
jgi:N utilization substance protein B